MKSGRPFILVFFLFLMAFPAVAQETDSVKPQVAPAQDTAVRPKAADTTPRVVKPRPIIPKPVTDTTRKDSLARDTTRTASSVPAVTDSFTVCRVLPSVRLLFPVAMTYPTIYGSAVGGYMRQNERFNVTAPVQRKQALTRIVDDKDWIFYFFCGVLLVVSFVNIAFKKYFIDVFRVFFNTSLRQKQLREQLSQAPLPSLLLNILFCVSGGAFIFFTLRHYGIRTGLNPALELLAEAGLIAGIYLGKYIFVSLLGWMFDRRHAAENYLFTVFLVNKVAGLSLVPFTMLLAYVDKPAREVVLTLAFILLGIFILMRLTKGFAAINGLRVGFIPYLVFVGAFDIVPTLLVYKVLVNIYV